MSATDRTKSTAHAIFFSRIRRTASASASIADTASVSLYAVSMVLGCTEKNLLAVGEKNSVYAYPMRVRCSPIGACPISLIP